MDLDIPDEDLRRLATDETASGSYPPRVAALYRQTLQIVAAAPDEAALAGFRCLNYRKAGGRGARRVLSLTEDAELVVSVRNGRANPTVVVEKISPKRGRRP